MHNELGIQLKRSQKFQTLNLLPKLKYFLINYPKARKSSNVCRKWAKNQSQISVKPNFEQLNRLKVGAAIKCHACDRQLLYQEKECRAQINLTLFKAHNSTFDVYNVPVAPMFT